ncbi:MAG: hypothetical protein AAF965_00125 [Pseudomonadota bacterium]
MKTQKPIAARTKVLFAAAVALTLTASPALAYVGPGLGLATIGAILGGLAAVVLAIVGVFWYPIRSAMKKRKAAAAPDEAQKDTE